MPAKDSKDVRGCFGSNGTVKGTKCALFPIGLSILPSPAYAQMGQFFIQGAKAWHSGFFRFPLFFRLILLHCFFLVNLAQ